MVLQELVIDGIAPLEPVPDVSFGELIYQILSENSGKQPALIDGHTGEELTYSELLKQTCSLAQALRNNGYGPGTVMAVCSKNKLEYFYPIIAALYIGAIPAPINHDYSPLELINTLNVCKPKIIFCSSALFEKYSMLKGDMPFIEHIIVIDSRCTGEEQSLDDFIARSLVGSPVSKIVTSPVDTKNDIAFLMSSSGTTGLPKAVMVTHHNMNTLYIQFKDPRIHHQNPITLCIPPFFHAYGLFTTLAGIMRHGTTVVLSEFEGKSFLQAIEKYKVNRLFLVPPLVLFLTKSDMVPDYDLSSIDEVTCAAAPLKESTERKVKERLGLKVIRQGYGLTETTCAIMFTERGDDQWRPGSSGKVLPYSQFAVRDLETKEFVGPHQSGEICIKSDMVMKGYYGNPEATKNTFSEDGWFLSGDIGYYDEDQYFYVTDRIKELIKYNGYQVAPAELEALLLTHPEIQDSGVVGLPDEKAGELPVAFVVKAADSKLCEKEVQNFVEKNLSHHKWLRGGVRFVDKVPKNPSGKILRKELRRILREK